MNNLPSVPLALLVERQFIADCCGGRSKDYVSQIRLAVRLFGSDLGRPATTADLCGPKMLDFCRHLRNVYDRVEQIRMHKKRLVTVWRYAHRRGLAGPCETVTLNDDASPLQLPACEDRPKCGFSLDAPAPVGTALWYFQTVFEPQELLACSAGYRADHRGVHRSLYAHYRRLIRLDEQTDALAADHFGWMKAAGKTNWSINNLRKYWFCQWRHAAGRGHVEHWPRLRALKVHRGAPDAWSVDELKRMLAVASPWWRALLLVGLHTLARLRALFSLPVANVDLDSATVHFPPTSIKTSTGLRCRIGDDAVSALRAIWPPAGPLVFLKPPKVHRDFQQLLAAAGVAPSPRRNGQFHKLRRSAATFAAARGGLAIASDLLGQTSKDVVHRYVAKEMLPSHDVSALIPRLCE